MNWLRDLVRPRILTSTKKEVKANVWEKCPACGEMIYENDLAENLHVCSACGHHLRMSLDSRFAYLFDGASIEEIKVGTPKEDPLKFKDRKKYIDRLKDTRKKKGQKDAFKVVVGKINGEEVVVTALDFTFMGGSMGQHVGEAVVQGAKEAVRRNVPFMVIPASGGARMHEGILSLMQMARTTAAIQEVKEAGLPYFVLLTDPTTGGVTASFAMLGDVMIAEPGALIGFAGPRVIQQTIGETLPEGFQRAEYLLEHGMVDMVTSRFDQPKTIANLCRMLTGKHRKVFKKPSVSSQGL